MTSVLERELSAVLAPGMSLPEPLGLLYQWIESRGLFLDRPDGRIGFLYPEAEGGLAESTAERSGGTDVEFHAVGNANLHHWFGHDDPAVLSRLCVFARTGGEGSMAALWLDDTGGQTIVHLGSGSGSTLVCVLADDPVDFLRLLAIGYDEICWDHEFGSPPNQGRAEGDLFVHPNREYQEWVSATFSTTVPRTALEIIRHPVRMGDAESLDPFCRWVEDHAGD